MVPVKGVDLLASAFAHQKAPNDFGSGKIRREVNTFFNYFFERGHFCDLAKVKRNQAGVDNLRVGGRIFLKK